MKMKKITIEDLATGGFSLTNLDYKGKRTSVRVPKALLQYFREKCRKEQAIQLRRLGAIVEATPKGLSPTQAVIYSLFIMAAKDGVL